MKRPVAITTLLVDIGGVLPTDGWSRETSQLAAATFGLDFAELNKQHGEALGIRRILHTDYASTRAQLALFGLRD